MNAHTPLSDSTLIGSITQFQQQLKNGVGADTLLFALNSLDSLTHILTAVQLEHLLYRTGVGKTLSSLTKHATIAHNRFATLSVDERNMVQQTSRRLLNTWKGKIFGNVYSSTNATVTGTTENTTQPISSTDTDTDDEIEMKQTKSVFQSIHERIEQAEVRGDIIDLT